MFKVSHSDKQLEIAKELGIHHPCTVEMPYDFLVSPKTKGTFIAIQAKCHQDSDNVKELIVA